MISKFLITVGVIVAGIYYGYNYILSPKFQEYGDRTKAPWTCTANNYIGGYYQMLSDYQGALKFYAKVGTRCPKSPQSEEALYQTAVCYESIAQFSKAAGVYKQYLEEYENSSRRVTVENALRIIQSNHR